jgi:hypothetical protein
MLVAKPEGVELQMELLEHDADEERRDTDDDAHPEQVGIAYQLRSPV